MLHKAIAMWMVRGGMVQADAKELETVSEEAAGELETPISGDIRRDAKPGDPAREEGLKYSGCLNVGQWESLQPSCLPLYTCEEVSVSISNRQRANQVQVDSIEPARRRW